ncbi:hypothetical protein CHISP_0045 [Chitinispirillum alkaliphilum]|nr:hypothetical protein CHISP_0045 [Chitinispirillum alkaliphilum]
MGKLKIFLFVLVFMMSLAASAEEAVTVEAEGIGRNRAEAVLNAQRAAVETGIGTIIQSETEIRNFMVNRDVVLTRTVGAVRSYEILSESGTEVDGNITVKIRATVSKSQIRDDLAALQILLETMDKPRVMVMIQESNMEDNSPGQIAETEILNFLSEKGFNLIDPGVVQQLKQHEKAMQALEGNTAAAAVIGAEAGADMIIVGSAVSRAAEGVSVNLGGMVSCQADVSIRVVVCATASVVTAKSEQSAAVHVSAQSGGARAIAQAARKVMDTYILDRIVSSWQDAINNGLPLRVVVSDVNSFSATNTIIRNLREVSGVVNVTNRGWNQGTGLMELEVVYKGNTYGLCEIVDGMVMADRSSLMVTGVTANGARLAYRAASQ